MQANIQANMQARLRTERRQNHLNSAMVVQIQANSSYSGHNFAFRCGGLSCVLIGPHVLVVSKWGPCDVSQGLLPYYGTTLHVYH